MPRSAALQLQSLPVFALYKSYTRGGEPEWVEFCINATDEAEAKKLARGWERHHSFHGVTVRPATADQSVHVRNEYVR